MNLSRKNGADSLSKIPSLQVNGVISEVISNCCSLTFLNLEQKHAPRNGSNILSSSENLKLDISFTDLTGPSPQFEKEIQAHQTAKRMLQSKASRRNMMEIRGG